MREYTDWLFEQNPADWIATLLAQTERYTPYGGKEAFKVDLFVRDLLTPPDCEFVSRDQDELSYDLVFSETGEILESSIPAGELNRPWEIVANNARFGKGKEKFPYAGAWGEFAEQVGPVVKEGGLKVERSEKERALTRVHTLQAAAECLFNANVQFAPQNIPLINKEVLTFLGKLGEGHSKLVQEDGSHAHLSRNETEACRNLFLEAHVSYKAILESLKNTSAPSPDAKQVGEEAAIDGVEEGKTAEMEVPKFPAGEGAAERVAQAQTAEQRTGAITGFEEFDEIDWAAALGERTPEAGALNLAHANGVGSEGVSDTIPAPDFKGDSGELDAARLAEIKRRIEEEDGRSTEPPLALESTPNSEAGVDLSKYPDADDEFFARPTVPNVRATVPAESSVRVPEDAGNAPFLPQPAPETPVALPQPAEALTAAFKVAPVPGEGPLVARRVGEVDQLTEARKAAEEALQTAQTALNIATRNGWDEASARAYREANARFIELNIERIQLEAAQGQQASKDTPLALQPASAAATKGAVIPIESPQVFAPPQFAGAAAEESSPPGVNGVSSHAASNGAATPALMLAPPAGTVPTSPIRYDLEDHPANGNGASVQLAPPAGSVPVSRTRRDIGLSGVPVGGMRKPTLGEYILFTLRTGRDPRQFRQAVEDGSYTKWSGNRSI